MLFCIYLLINFIIPIVTCENKESQSYIKYEKIH